MMAGQSSEVYDSAEAFQKFFEWKSVKMNKLIHVRNGIDAALQVLADWFGGSLKKQDEAEKRIIMSACNQLLHEVQQEQSMITVIQQRYSSSVEFKKHCEEWLNRRPNINILLSVKKTVKRCKVLEKNNFEEV